MKIVFIALTFFVVNTLLATLFLRGTSYYVAFGYDWRNARLTTAIGNGSAWAIATRSDQPALVEMFEGAASMARPESISVKWSDGNGFAASPGTPVKQKRRK